MSNSYTPPDRSTYDPGWNDPPPMPSVTASIAAVAKPRTSLNKRVAFPMQQSSATAPVASSTNVKTTAEGLPLPFSTAKYQPLPMTASAPESTLAPEKPILLPPPPSSILSPVDPSEATTTESITETFDASTAKPFILSVFSRSTDAMASNSDLAKLVEIRKRLYALDLMWQENKLDECVQMILYELAKALDNKDAENAMEQHRLLVTQHINVSTQWATALRQLIISISSESQSDDRNAPAVLPDTDVVQFVDVSSKPTILDSIPGVSNDSLPNPGPATIPISNQQQSGENYSDSNANVAQSNSEDEPKSRLGRFGKILHI